MKKLVLELFACIKKVQNNFLPLLLRMIDVKLIALFWRRKRNGMRNFNPFSTTFFFFKKTNCPFHP